MGFRPKNCLDCQQSFQPRSGRQERCDNCRPVATVTVPEPLPNAKDKECVNCGNMFKPNSNAQKKCIDCRAIEEVTIEKPCECCEKMFIPVTKQKVCNDCLLDESIPRCVCGSMISGRAKWGDNWGGQCDRAEGITDRLMKGLSSRSSH
jgi:hypothetical protein